MFPGCTYKLLEDPTAQDRFGVSVQSENDIVSIPHITGDQEQIFRLIDRLRRGNVTPVTLRDIVEDFLAE